MTQGFQSLTRWGKPPAESQRCLQSSFWLGWRWQVLAWAPSHYITNTNLCKTSPSCWHCWRWFHSLRWKKALPQLTLSPSKGNLLLHTGKSLTVPGSASQELSKAPNSSFHWRKRNTPTTKLNLREQACVFIIKHNKRAQYCTETMEGGPQSLVLKIKVLVGLCTGSYKSSLLHFSHQGPQQFPHHPSPYTPPLGHLEIQSHKPHSLCTIHQTQVDVKLPLPHSKGLLLHFSL